MFINGTEEYKLFNLCATMPRDFDDFLYYHRLAAKNELTLDYENSNSGVIYWNYDSNKIVELTDNGCVSTINLKENKNA